MRRRSLVVLLLAMVVGVLGVGLGVGGATVGAVGAPVRCAFPLCGGIEVVGRAGDLVTVGIAAEQGRALAFVTDGNQVGLWFAGSIRDGAGSFSDTAGNRLTVRLAEKSATGTLRLAGKPEVQLRAAPVTGSAGLLRMVRRTIGPTGTTVETSGWVVQPDGSVRGVRRIDRSGGSIAFVSSPKLHAQASRVSGLSLLPTCKPVKLEATGAAATEPAGCGLPDGRIAAPPTASFAITHRSKAAGLTDAQLKAEAAKLKKTTRTAARARGLRWLTADDRLAFGAYTKTLTSPGVLAAAERLRAALLSGNSERISSRLAEYDSTARANGLTPLPLALRKRVESLRNGLPALPPVAPKRGVSVPTSLTIPNSDYALATSSSKHGSFASDPFAQALISGSGATAGQLILKTLVMVGFQSTAEADALGVARFKVPPAVREVEIEFDAAFLASQHTSYCTWGIALASATAGIFVEQIGPNGSTGETVGSEVHFDWGGPPPPCAACIPPLCFWVALPIPDPLPLIATGPYRITFPPAQSGGEYLIKLHSWGSAEVLAQGDGSAITGMWLKSTTIRFRR